MTDYADSKRGRGEAFLATLSSNEHARYLEAAGRIRLELAKLHGDKLAEIVIENALLESAMHFDLIPFIHGDDTPVNWRGITEGIVAGDDMIQTNLAHSCEAETAQIKEQTLRALRPEQRMSMQRDGTLNTHLENAVSEQLSIN